MLIFLGMNERHVTQEAEQLMFAAVRKLESKSVRDWATSAHNAPIFQTYVEGLVRKGKRCTNADDVLRLSAYICCLYLG